MEINKNFKFSNDEELFMKVIVEKGHDEFNRPFVKTAWVKIGKDFNLGSIAKPNPECDNILGFKWVQKNPLGNIFKNMFGE